MQNYSNIVISQIEQYHQLKNSKHLDSTDDFLRMITSPQGQFLASITERRQLTLYNLKNQSIIENFSEENVIYCSFSENGSKFIELTKNNTIKFYEINNSNQANSTQISLQQEIKINSFNNTLGWGLWTIDNDKILFINQGEFFSIDSSKFSIEKIISSKDIKSQCAPYYLTFDRINNNFVSSSKTGTVCRFETIYSSALNNSQFQFNILDKVIVGNNYTIADIGQSQNYLFLNTAKINSITNAFYNSYILPKTNYSKSYLIKIQSELIAPGLMIQLDNVNDYLLAFIKGENNLYLFSLQQIKANNSSATSANPFQLTNNKKITVPFLLHSIHYNGYSNDLLFGITGEKNEDEILYMNFQFNCTNIFPSSNQPQLKSFCTQECKQINGQNSYFSFNLGDCHTKTSEYQKQFQKCNQLIGKGYFWDYFNDECSLNCSKVSNSFSKLSYSTPSQCFCNQDYVWSISTNECDMNKSLSALSNQTVSNNTSKPNNTNSSNNTNDQQKNNTANQKNNTSSKNNDTTINITTNPNSQQNKTIKNNTNHKNETTENSSSVSPAVPVVIVIIVILCIILIIYLLFRYKKLCFSAQDDENEANQNELKQTDYNQSQKGQNKDNNIQNNQNIQSNENLSQLPQSIKSHHTDQQEAQSDSERKLE